MAQSRENEQPRQDGEGVAKSSKAPSPLRELARRPLEERNRFLRTVVVDPNDECFDWWEGDDDGDGSTEEAGS